MRDETPVSQSGDNFLVGKLLIAMPGMSDARFDRSVIFMCAHSNDGAMGLIVNKPVAGVAFGELLRSYDLAADAPVDVPVLFGGPVETGRGFILHSNDYAGNVATLAVTAEISLTASIDILRAISEGRGPKQRVMALGYAGWGEGQIESEILANGWIHCDADPELVFGSHYDSMWQKAIAKLGVNLSGLTGAAGRA
jgi:putative transcriptional regulator